MKERRLFKDEEAAIEHLRGNFDLSRTGTISPKPGYTPTETDMVAVRLLCTECQCAWDPVAREVRPRRFKQAGPSFCWECGNDLMIQKGGAFIYALVRDRAGVDHRVHKDCVQRAVESGDGVKEVK